MKPLVCIFAHPDDEAFGPAGSIAKFASERDVYIICVTNGDSHDQFTKKDGYAKKLGEIRRNEMQKSAKVLGVKKVIFLEFSDGSLSNNLYHEIANKIESILQELKPDIIMTFEQKGVSGHIDHITVSMVSTFVFQKLEFIKNIFYYGELKEMMKLIPSYFIYIPPGYEREEFDLHINIEEFWDKKLKAMEQHESQEEDRKLVLGILEKFPKEEHFFVAKK